jgi:hypothetical protein
MENTKTVKIDSMGQTVEHTVIEHTDGSTTSMTKAEYDRRQAEQSTPIVIDETKTK